MSFLWQVVFSTEDNQNISGDKNANPELNITEVLDTWDKLWLYNQTTPNTETETFEDLVFNLTQTCIYNVKISISPSEYNFTQNMTVNTDWVSRNYTGVFLKNITGKPPVSMLISDASEDPEDSDEEDDSDEDQTDSIERRSDATPSGSESEKQSNAAFQMATLMYTDPGNHSCSVYFVIPLDNATLRNDFPVCEMYIKDLDVDSGPSNGCKTFFERYCSKKRTYSPYTKSCRSTTQVEENNIET